MGRQLVGRGVGGECQPRFARLDGGAAHPVLPAPLHPEAAVRVGDQLPARHRAQERAGYLVYTPKNGSGFVSRFVDLVGIERVTPPPRLEVLPYTTGKAELSSRTPGNPFNDGSKLTPGIGADARIGLGPNLTLNATVNPDFGQVEVDPAV